MQDNTITVGKAFRDGWNSFMARPWFWIGVTFLCTVVSEIISAASGIVPEMAGQGSGSVEVAYALILAFFLINTLVSMRISMGMVWMAITTVDGKRAKISDLLAKPHVFWRYLFAVMVFGLVLLVGFALLIVPGIYLFARFFPLNFVVMERETGALESFRQAQQLTEGHRGKLIEFILLWFALFIVLAIVVVPAEMLLEPLGRGLVLVVAVIATPIAWLSSASLYRTLGNASAAQTTPG